MTRSRDEARVGRGPLRREGSGRHAAARAGVVLAGALLVASSALAQTAETDYEPRIGQPGKDVIWVPTADALVDRMLTMAEVGPGDVVYDLGSGDGRTVIAAAKRGAEAVGVEFNPDLVLLSRSRARSAGLEPEQARFIEGDIFETDFSRATVVTLYLLSELNLRLRPKILEMPPGTRVVSHMFDMREWEPDQTVRLGYGTAYLWIVPTEVGGSWQLALDGGPTLALEIEQSFQMLAGTVGFDPVPAALEQTWLRGDEIGFSFAGPDGVVHELTGTVSGGRMQGSFRAGGRPGDWTASRR